LAWSELPLVERHCYFDGVRILTSLHNDVAGADKTFSHHPCLEEKLMSDVRNGALGLYDLTGRVAVITGGSSGVGAASARRLAELGATIVIGYNSGQGRAEALAAELPGSGHIPLHLPITDSAAIRSAVAQVEAR
jgi:hypothetical protein